MIEAPVDVSFNEAEHRSFATLIRMVGDNSEVEAIVPPSVAETTVIQASVHSMFASTPRLCLTTSRLLKDCLKVRETEFRRQVTTNKAKEFGRITPSPTMTVKMTPYLSADDVWPVKAPAAPHEYQPWLPVLSKNAKTPLTISDLESLETMARCSARLGSSLDSAFQALCKLFGEKAEQPPFKDLANWMGCMIRDHTKMDTYMASTLMYLRRDAVLEKAPISAIDKATLRAAPIVESETLFDADMVEKIVKDTRARAHDMHLAKASAT